MKVSKIILKDLMEDYHLPDFGGKWSTITASMRCFLIAIFWAFIVSEKIEYVAANCLSLNTIGLPPPPPCT